MNVRVMNESINERMSTSVRKWDFEENEGEEIRQIKDLVRTHIHVQLQNIFMYIDRLIS